MTPRCASCNHFWLSGKSDKTHNGRCHRYPPAFVPTACFQGHVDGRWEHPVVDANSSCGEHSPRQQTEDCDCNSANDRKDCPRYPGCQQTKPE